MSPVKILFVGQWDVAKEVAAAFNADQGKWNVHFCPTANEALNRLKTQAYDAIVTELELAGMTADELLRKVQEQYPTMVRFVLTSSADTAALIRALGVAHQVVSKPCKPDHLEKLVTNSLAMRVLLNNDELHARIARINKLPVLPSIYNQLVNEMQSESASIQKIAELIRGDVAITARVLQMINSAHFGLSHRVESLLQAVNLLGLDVIKALVLTSGVFSQFKESGLPGFLLDEIYSHSLSVGRGAQNLADAFGLDRRHAEEALTAGALHDIGKLVLVTNFEKEARQIVKVIQNEQIPLHDAEQNVLGISHCEIGAHLLSLWGLSDRILEAVALHDEPQKATQPTLNVLTAVHLANAFDHDVYIPNSSSKQTTANIHYLKQVGIENQLPQLRSLVPSKHAKTPENVTT